MSWAQIRSEARADVHAAFGLSASYTPPGGATLSGILVRWHTRSMRHGDLDREGYGQVNEDINRLILDTNDVPAPVRNALLVLEDGTSYHIEYVLPYDGRFVPCDVVRVKA